MKRRLRYRLGRWLLKPWFEEAQQVDYEVIHSRTKLWRALLQYRDRNEFWQGARYGAAQILAVFFRYPDA